MALMTGLILAAFLASLDQTIVSTALPAIASSFDELSLISWVGISYLLTSTAFQPLYGKFSDIFGRKAMMLFAIIVFTIGSVLCGAAQSMIMLIVCRAIAGLGGAGLMSMSMIIISEVYQSAITGVFAVSYVIGPLLGGVFTDHVSAITVTTSVFCIQLPPLNNGSFRDKIKSIDFLGYHMYLLSTCWGGSTFPWQHPIIITLYAVGGVLLVRYAKQPIIPPYLFATRNVALSFIANFFIGIGFFGILFYMPLWYQVVRDASATTSGINIMPMSLGIILFSAIAGWSVSLTDYCRPFILAGAVLFTLGTGLLSLLNVETPYGVEAIILTIIGIGVGLIMQTLLVAAQSAATSDNLAAATTYARAYSECLRGDNIEFGTVDRCDSTA
ncbi:major facilitator superfamily domain-containing protein [Syncephalis plumigaleata]|nr:major facilitator superfamily domain-containing protein [Syncephalis plumigaleata]